jgi:hypothetical protein
MDTLNLAPVVGEEVRWADLPGVYKIVRVRAPGNDHPNPNLQTPLSGFGTVDLKQVGSNFTHEAVPWAVLKYVDEATLVRRAIEWLKTKPDGRSFPDYVVDYEVTAGDDHAGNPAIFVRFFVDPDYFYRDAWPPNEKAAELNQFLDEVQTELLSLDLNRWIYVRASEAQRDLDVAS